MRTLNIKYDTDEASLYYATAYMLAGQEERRRLYLELYILKEKRSHNENLVWLHALCVMVVTMIAVPIFYFLPLIVAILVLVFIIGGDILIHMDACKVHRKKIAHLEAELMDYLL